MGRAAVGAVLAALVVALASCGDDESSSGRVTLNLWVFNEPSGTFTNAAKRCSDASNGKYEIVYNKLSNDADQQRQSLVRRLAAEDDSIDIAGMDVVWTAEFAEAEWILPWPEKYATEFEQNTLKGPLQTATYNDRVYAAPANTNTQLLWYRKDLVPNPAETWTELIKQASELPKAGRIEIQGAQYEGTTVWFNSLVASAGGTIVENEKPTPSEAWLKAATIMRALATSPAADPSLSAQKEDQNRQAFESGEAAFQINYPFIYPSAKEGNPEVFKEIGWKRYPKVDAGQESKPPIGGINWGVGAFTKHPDLAFEAAACLRNEKNQREAAALGGLPPTIAGIYDDPKFQKDYPFAGLIRDSVDTGAVRPQTPAYADVSLAIYKLVSPGSSIELDGFVDTLNDRLNDALESKGLF
jgi:ABC-type glycerol-3-phosphate transport system substrate-binding protein